MGHQDAPNFSRKHPSDEKPDQAIADAVKKSANKDGISCASAFKIVANLDVSAAEVGKTIDLLDLKLMKCQLGLFGYAPERSILKPVESVPADLESAIKNAMKDGRLSCLSAWEIAKTMDLKKLDVAFAAESMGIKIKPCQLGAF